MALLSDIEIEDLRYLIALANTGSVKEGKEELGVLQSTFSKRIAIWKKKGGLVQRSGKQLNLTKRGKKVAAVARKIVRQFDQLSSFIRSAEERPNSVVVSSGMFGAAWYWAPVVARLAAEINDYHVQVQIMRGSKRIESVAKGEIDAAIVSHGHTQIALYSSPHELKVNSISEQPVCVAAHRQSCLLYTSDAADE